jgi:site-specific DNA recombinase
MKQCFAYISVSTVKQGEGVSLEAQRDAITDFANRRNLHIALNGLKKRKLPP